MNDIFTQEFIATIRENIQYGTVMAECIGGISGVLSKLDLHDLLMCYGVDGDLPVYQFSNGEVLFYSHDINFGKRGDLTWIPNFHYSKSTLTFLNGTLVDVQPQYTKTIFPPREGMIVLETIEALTDYLIASDITEPV